MLFKVQIYEREVFKFHLFRVERFGRERFQICCLKRICSEEGL